VTDICGAKAKINIRSTGGSWKVTGPLIHGTNTCGSSHISQNATARYHYGASGFERWRMTVVTVGGGGSACNCVENPNNWIGWLGDQPAYYPPISVYTFWKTYHYQIGFEGSCDTPGDNPNLIRVWYQRWRC
jgi:hypothetical protein